MGVIVSKFKPLCLFPLLFLAIESIEIIYHLRVKTLVFCAR